MKEVMVPIPAELTMIHEQSVPGHGDNSVLFDYALECTAIRMKYQDQMTALRKLQ